MQFSQRHKTWSRRRHIFIFSISARQTARGPNEKGNREIFLDRTTENAVCEWKHAHVSLSPCQTGRVCRSSGVGGRGSWRKMRGRSGDFQRPGKEEEEAEKQGKREWGKMKGTGTAVAWFMLQTRCSSPYSRRQPLDEGVAFLICSSAASSCLLRSAVYLNILFGLLINAEHLQLLLTQQ